MIYIIYNNMNAIDIYDILVTIYIIYNDTYIIYQYLLTLYMCIYIKVTYRNHKSTYS